MDARTIVLTVLETLEREPEFKAWWQTLEDIEQAERVFNELLASVKTVLMQDAFEKITAA